MRTNETPSPLIKWAGGKRQLLDRIDSRLPAKYGHYYSLSLVAVLSIFIFSPKRRRLMI